MPALGEIEFWHARFTQQATWTGDLFLTLARQSGFEKVDSVLEVGCGTGAALRRVSMLDVKTIFGLDLRLEHLRFAANHAPIAHLMVGDAHRLPLPDRAIDLVFCHFLLLWVRDPVSVLREMKRVTRDHGWVIALAEPDYEHRIDMPDALKALGRAQTAALYRQGADPCIGRRLPDLFQEAGISLEASGVLGGYWSGNKLPDGWDLEWQTLRHDLADDDTHLPFETLMETDRMAWLQSIRILYVPVFYAIGRIP